MRFCSLSVVLLCTCGLQVLADAACPYAAETASREARFANPPASARILPIHHHRANDLARADAEVDTLIAEGFGGTAGNVSFENYLESPEAWQTYKHFVDRSHAYGLVHWLYDEKGYPSCTAGGKTLEGHPEWQARAYLVAVTNVTAGSAALPPSPPGKPVATIRRRSADGATDTVYVITDDYIREGTHVSVSVSKYKYAYPNLLMAEPTARFIELTHNAYAKNLGASLKSVTSTFTDEPSLMTWWMRPMPYLCLPVSDELLAAYARTAGHPLADDVPSLVGGAPRGEVAAARHRFWTMVGERVARNYTGQLTKWCDAHGIESGGHLLCEEGLVVHVCLYGDFFKVLRGLSAPSADLLTSIPAQVPWVTPLLVGSAGDLNGSKHTMSEASDHCQRYRKPGDTRPMYYVNEREIVGSLNRQIWGGINTFTSYYRWTGITPERKRAVNEEIGRVQTLLHEGRNAAEIALLYPADSLMVGFEPKKRGVGGALAGRTEGLFKSVGTALFKANRSFMIVDTASLEAAKVDGAELVKDALRWRTILLAGVTTLPVATARRLEEFRKAGGLVLVVGEKPRNSESAFPSDEVTHLAANWTFLDDGVSSLVAEVVRSRHAPALACVRGKPGVLRTAHRRTASSGDVFFVMNDTPEVWSGAVRLADGGAARIWNPRLGLTSTATGDIPLELPPFAAVVLTTESPVRGRLVANAALPFETHLVPLTEKVTRTKLGKGTSVDGEATPLADGWQRVETTLTKGGVDTYAFFHTYYAKSPFGKDAKGVGVAVRVPETTGGDASCGIFLLTKDGRNWYANAHKTLSEKGAFEASIAFSDFALHGRHGDNAPTQLNPADITGVTVGFGGYYGQAGERIVFEVSAPKAFVIQNID